MDKYIALTNENKQLKQELVDKSSQIDEYKKLVDDMSLFNDSLKKQIDNLKLELQDPCLVVLLSEHFMEIFDGKRRKINNEWHSC
jgi:DNA repair exonuclease SbcCD ATPase subunit